MSHTGTGSDVKVPKKPERPRSLHTANHRRLANKDPDNQIGPDSRRSSNPANVPTLADDGLSPPRDQNAQTNGRGADGNEVAARRRGQNSKDWESNLPKSRPPGDKAGSAASPHKHREKRKHCESVDSTKHKKRKHGRDARFEGHRISHLVKKKAYNREENEEEEQKKSDDYVLAKLFKKSGGIQCLRTF